jgi:hypothetical protein
MYATETVRLHVSSIINNNIINNIIILITIIMDAGYDAVSSHTGVRQHT